MENFYMIDTNILFSIFLIIISMYVRKYIAKNTIQFNALQIATFCSAICLLSEALYIYYISKLSNANSNYLPVLITYVICSLFSIIGTSSWALFIKTYISKETQTSKQSLIKFLVPCVIGCLIIIYTPVVDFISYTNGANYSITSILNTTTYTLSNIELIIIILYNIYCISILTLNVKKISALEYSLLLFLEIIPILGIYLNMVNSSLMSTYYLFTIALITTYLTLQDNFNYYDSKTNGLTKDSLDNLLYNNIAKGFLDYSIIYLEIDNYNSLKEKDLSVKYFSDLLLNNLTGKNQMAYIGNNQFVVYLETINKDVIYSYTDKISSTLMKDNIKNEEKINFLSEYEICAENNKTDLLMIVYTKLYEKKINKKEVIV